MPAVATPPRSVAASTYPLNVKQRAVAQQIVDAGRQSGATNEEIIAALSTGISETNLNPNVPGDGGQAIGVFQQHASYGDTATRQNVPTAATAFFQRLIGLRSKNEPIGAKVADVQRPLAQYRGVYTTNLDEALTVYNQVAGSPYSGTIADLRPVTDVTTTTTVVAGKTFNSGFAPFVDHLISQVKGLTVTSGQRTAAKNAAVGGVADSQHLAGTAVDVTGSPDAIAQATKVAQASGLEAINEGTHLHIELPPGKTYGTDYAGNLIDTSSAVVNPQNMSTQTAPGIYKALDRVLNDSPGLVDTLTDPLGSTAQAGKIIVARGMFAIAGITISVFGLILVVGAVSATKTVRNTVGSVAGPSAGSGAAGAVESVAESAAVVAA